MPTDEESPPHAGAARLDLSLRDWALCHQHEVMHTTTWMGVQIRKNPLDAWVCQELLHRVRPDVVIEIGSYVGGSTLYFANLLDLLGHGEVISIDVSRAGYGVDHPRVVEVTGSSGDSAVIDEVARRCSGRRTFVIHDGDHRRDAVLGDLRAYGGLVSVGSYFVVEDGIVDLYPVGSALHPAKIADGPLRAVEAFLAEDDRFEIDGHCERYGLTWNPAGFLRRVK
ncbi:MAG: cephalosporin hydroxylase family protein [Solirubrobacterales bacterium]|nr:cephalosporin hydroxylase family protein [Solirubrobacterales bacterium]